MYRKSFWISLALSRCLWLGIRPSFAIFAANIPLFPHQQNTNGHTCNHPCNAQHSDVVLFSGGRGKRIMASYLRRLPRLGTTFSTICGMTSPTPATA